MVDSTTDFQQPRSVRKRVSRWTRRAISQFLDGSTEQTSTSPSTHQTGAYSTTSAFQDHDTQHGAQDQASVADHYYLRFKASPLPTSTLTTSALTTNATASCEPYPPKISITCVDFLGDVHSATTNVIRDLGFQGRLGPYVLLSYGDTLYSDAGYSDTWRGMTSDSVALATQNPLIVVDPVLNSEGYPPQFCPLISSFGEDPSECAMGITNVVETTASKQGIMFFLINHRPNGTNNLMGAGVASVTLDISTYPPVPQIHRLPPQFWWDAKREPWYGDVCALRWKNYIYAYGHGIEGNSWVYLTRVPVAEATNIDCYEYWNGKTWQNDRLDGTIIGDNASVFWQINQGQVIWSNYFQCLLFVYCDNWMNSKVLMKTAQRPEGPWSDPITLYQATPLTKGSSIYAAVPHPYYDESGKTLVVTFTNHPNTIQAVRVVFA